MFLNYITNGGLVGLELDEIKKLYEYRTATYK
jgi:hypothetical protein